MIQTQTFEFDKGTKAELAVVSKVLDLLGKGLIDDAKQVLISRHDELTKEPVLKLYDQRVG